MAANKIIKKLYDGEVQITFYPDSHRYQLLGEKTFLISVTGATGIVDKSRMLIPWAVGLAGAHLRQYMDSMAGNAVTLEELAPVIDEALKQHTIKKDKAADIGTIVHDFAENFAKFSSGMTTIRPNIGGDQPEEVKNGIFAFLDWFNTNEIVFLEAERLIYSKKHKFCGLVDAIAIVNGKFYLIDYKTGKGIYKEAYYQTAGYVLAYEEETESKVDGVLILNFNKETGALKSEIISKKDIIKNKKTFLACLTVKQREKELDRLYFAK